ILAEKGQSGPALMFYGHMDTVGSSAWVSDLDALTPKMIESCEQPGRNLLFGLGANDMKAGLSVMCTALAGINPDGFRIKVAFGVDEEFYSLGANVLAASDFMDGVAALVVPELGDGPNPCHGVGTICLGRLGRCEFEIIVPGTGGHGAESMMPGLVNAATDCAKIVVELERRRRKHRDRFRFFSGRIPGGSARRTIDGSFFVSKVESGDGTLSVPCSGRIVVDWTFTPEYSIDKALNLLQDTLDNMYRKGLLKPVIVSGQERRVSVSAKNRPTPHSEAFITHSKHSFVHFLRSVIGLSHTFVNFNMGYSVADENVFHRIHPEVPLVVIGPVGRNCHRADEWVDVSSVTDLEQVFRRLAEEFPGYLR
ncbi:MAG: M20/M25/M40 family metallo-hydrolase, partial [Candidatus Wallbacteria bacterium]|nr:M20/M25/M40 family metallo-hydrolase [Candidatus Wallbacteria bacterium]